MKYIIKFLLIATTIITVTNAKEVGVVNTDILLVKKYPIDTAKKLSFYKMNDLIDILSEQEDNQNNKWYKTNNGFVKAQYVIKKSNLPKFIDESMVDFNKNAIQLIVYNLNAKKALLQLQKNLKNEKNLYIQKTKKAQVVYLVNFQSYKDAKQKQKQISQYYKTCFITKIRNLTSKKNNLVKTIVNIPKKIKSLSVPKQKYEEFDYKDINIEDEVATIDVDKQMAEFDDDNEADKKTQFQNNSKDLYTVNKVQTLNFSNNKKEKIIKKELDNIEEIKVTKILNKKKKEKLIKPIKEILHKRETKSENNYYVNNGDETKKYKTKSRFNLRVFDHSKKIKKPKPETFNNNYFKNEVKVVKPVVMETIKPKIEEVTIEKIIPAKKVEVIKANLTDKIENLLIGL